MPTNALLTATLVDDAAPLDLAQLARACRAAEADIQVWVVEGVLAPAGRTPAEWRFDGDALRRARLASRLTRDLEVNVAGVALALDLLDRIEALEADLRRGGR